MFLAIKRSHPARVVTVIRHLVGRNRSFYRGQLARRQGHLERTQGLSEPVPPLGADQRDDVQSSGGNPGDRELCRCPPAALRDLLERFEQAEVSTQVVTL